MSRQRLAVFIAASVSFSFFSFTAPARAADSLSGAGSSAAAPVYKVWAAEYEKQHGLALRYAPVGSGAGMASIRKREVDFGASDVMPAPAELQRDGLVMVPTVITGVVPVVNLPKVAPNALRLDGPTLARIFLGEIARWDAPEIRALNPQLALPDLPIRRVVRADGSGTSYHFSDYLSRVSPAWRQRYGVASKFAWSGEVRAVSGSAQVSAAVRETPGAIGYIDYNYVVDDALCGVTMRNADGQFVAAGTEGFRQAVTRSAWSSDGDFTAELNDKPGPRTWPITMGTYIALPKVATPRGNTEQALRFITWAYLHGDALARQARFVPLPDQVQANAYKEIAKVSSADGEHLGLRLIASLVR